MEPRLVNKYGLMSKYFIYFLPLLLLVACAAGPPSIIYASDNYVTVGHFNSGLFPTLTPQARDLAERHCKKSGKIAVYTGVFRDSGFGPEEYDFRCHSTPKANREGEAEKAKEEKEPSSGSGFLISRTGLILTNEHVVEDCIKIVVGKDQNIKVPVLTVNSDTANDIALLEVDRGNASESEINKLLAGLENKSVPTMERGLLRENDVELGEAVLVAGFPYGEFFGDSLKVTGGMVSANTGFGSNTGEFQIDAAVQSGNSGGPIYDENGNIIGIVVSQLDKIAVAKVTGSLPENVNFGIKVNKIRQFLEVSGYQIRAAGKNTQLGTKELARIANFQTVLVTCQN